MSDLMTQSFTSPQVLRIAKISYRQLDYWTNNGIITPSISEANGSGTVRRFSSQDVVEIMILKKLLDHAHDLQMARKVSECLRAERGKSDPEYLIILDGQPHLAEFPDDLMTAISRCSGMVSVLTLAKFRDRLDSPTEIES